ncbi:MAG TPA: TIGR00341 family protein [Patescibacteria group bacterium]|nr:TIGR00341 family protein [Patescibacteria group bacterium]
MSLIYTPHTFSRASKRQALEILHENITPDRDFYLLLIGAALLAIGAIFLDSIPVLIASMIVAPLAYPILGLGLSIASNDWRLARQSFSILLTAFIMAFLLAVIVTKLFGHTRVDNIFISFTPNRVLATGIALVAGFIASYGLVRPKVSNAITGVAIAVSLMPPLVASGIEFSSRRIALAKDALILFLLNVIGIVVASIVVFLVLGVAREHRIFREKQMQIGEH